MTGPEVPAVDPTVVPDGTTVELDTAARAEAEAAAAERLARDPALTWITMYHPELPNSPRSVVTEQAFNMLWASRGWERLTDEQAVQSETLGRTVSDSAPLTDAENDALRAAQGLNPAAPVSDELLASPEVPIEDSSTTATAAASKKTRTTTADVKEQ